MIKLIIGKKGLGKTKKLIELANEAVDKSNGNVIVIEKGAKLTYDLTHRARLIDTESYDIAGFEMLYGFIAGMCAGNYDITDIFVDSTFKICGNNMTELESFIYKLHELAQYADTQITLLISADASELPENLKAEYVKL